MNITTLRGEQTLQELTERLYGCLHGEQKQRAEMLLLKANPGLKAIGRLSSGALLTVPSLPGIRVAADPGKDDPKERIHQQIRDDLEAYREELRKAVAEARQQADRQLELAGSDEVRRLIGEDRNLKQVASALIDTLETRRKELQQRDDRLAQDPLA